MKYIFLICSLLILTSCNTNKNYKKPDWLVGKWVRTNNHKTNKTYEYWKPNFTGLGYTLQEKDTSFVEIMDIISNKGKLYLQIKGMERIPTLFEFTKQSENTFTVENEKVPFPKKIKYTLTKDTLTTVISNDEFSTDFKFVKHKE